MLPLDRLNEGQGIEAAMITIRLSGITHVGSITTTKCYKQQEIESIKPRNRMLHMSVVYCSLLKSGGELCFFCGEEGGPGTDGLHEVTTFQVDQCVRKCAKLTGDNFLLAKLSLGDMVALEAKYHTECLLALYKCARKVQAVQQQISSKDDVVSGIVFAELVMYIEEVFLAASISPVSKLTDMAQLYMSRIQQFGVMNDKRMHTCATKLKQRLFPHFPDMQSQSKGRDVMLVFDEAIGAALDKVCDQDSNSEAVHLARLHRLYADTCLTSTSFIGSFCQERSVRCTLSAFTSKYGVGRPKYQGPSL